MASRPCIQTQNSNGKAPSSQKGAAKRRGKTARQASEQAAVKMDLDARSLPDLKRIEAICCAGATCGKNATRAAIVDRITGPFRRGY